MIELTEWEVVETAWAEHASGPGWSNDLVHVLVYDRRTGARRVDTIQPGDQPASLAPFMPLLIAATATLVKAIEVRR